MSRSWHTDLRDVAITYRRYIGIALVVVVLVWAFGQLGGPDSFGALIEGAKGLLNTGGQG